jgi:hypothetical protein
MKILLLVNFQEPHASSLRNPSPVTGLYALITDDEKVLRFHGVNRRETPMSNPLYMEMDKYFFSEYNENKWRSWRRLNECFKPYNYIVSSIISFDRIVICEV